jgi:hypothetical protein
VVLPDSIRISRVRTYSGTRYHFKLILDTGLSPSMIGLSRPFSYQNETDVSVLQPRLRRFGLFPFRSSLLRESLLISCFRLLRYFSSPTFLHVLNGFGHTVRINAWVSPFGDLRVTAWLSARRSLSQIPTSFFGCISQGIRYTLVK